MAKHLSDLKSGVKSLTSHHVLPQCSNLSCSLSPVAHQELPCLPMLVLAVPSVRKDILLHVLLIKTLLILQSLCQMLPPLQSLPWSLQSGGSFFKDSRCGALPSQYFILSAAELLAPIHSHKHESREPVLPLHLPWYRFLHAEGTQPTPAKHMKKSG